MLVNATQDGGLIDNLFVGADSKVAPVSNVIAKFLNEEADTAATQNITTSKLDCIICEKISLHLK